MAPRRGSGGGSSGYSSSTCPYAFQEAITIAPFANDVIFFVVFLGITIALCVLRKKGAAGKGLLGLPLIGCLFFFLLTYICSIISTILLQCDATDATSYYSWNIAIVIFSYISYWLFLVVVVFNLNTMLRRQLDAGHSNAIFKIVPLAILGLMGLLSCAAAGMSAYVYYGSGRRFSFRYSYSSSYKVVLHPLLALKVAYYSLYLISLFASGGLALMTIMSLRRARKAGGDLLGWVAALTIAMVFWAILMIVFATWALNDSFRSSISYTWETSIALSYLVNFGQALSFIFILCIAKHVSWRKSTGAEPVAYQSQYAPVANPIGQSYQPYGYDANAPGQTYQYHQAPEFVGTNNHVRA